MDPMGDLSMSERGVVAVTATTTLDNSIAAGTVLESDHTLEWLSDTLVSGGSPWRLFRLSDHGASVLAGWVDGKSVSVDPSERSLARRFVDAGLMHPVSTARAPQAGEIEIVIPVRDDPGGLEAVLDALKGTRGPRVTVVDDASPHTTPTSSDSNRPRVLALRATLALPRPRHR
jgi:hypothetical protein